MVFESKRTRAIAVRPKKTEKHPVMIGSASRIKRNVSKYEIKRQVFLSYGVPNICGLPNSSYSSLYLFLNCCIPIYAAVHAIAKHGINQAMLFLRSTFWGIATAIAISTARRHQMKTTAKPSGSVLGFILPNVLDQPRPCLARLLRSRRRDKHGRWL